MNKRFISELITLFIIFIFIQILYNIYSDYELVMNSKKLNLNILVCLNLSHF